jgi:hypothetical protein
MIFIDADRLPTRFPRDYKLSDLTEYEWNEVHEDLKNRAYIEIVYDDPLNSMHGYRGKLTYLPEWSLKGHFDYAAVFVLIFGRLREVSATSNQIKFYAV